MARLRSGFRPPYCPNDSCDSRANPGLFRFRKKGYFVRCHRPYRVQRYQCQHCGRSFSSQTFSPTYWLRYTNLLERLFHRLVGGSCLRQISRELGVAHSTVQRQVERLGRHCLLFHERLRPRTAPREALVLDGFRTFEYSQYWPFDLNLLVGVSHYVYGFNDAELRRSGTMRPAQLLKRHQLEQLHGRPAPQATRDSVQELVGRIVPFGASATIRTDEHQSYPSALRRLRGRTLRHETTSSRATRTTNNPLFPVNLADLLIRHSSANHKRETIAFSKRRQGALYRAAVFTVWRNYVKSTSENRRDSPPGVSIGVIQRRLEVREVLRRRLFTRDVELSRWTKRCYFRRIPTRQLSRIRTHALRFAE